MKSQLLDGLVDSNSPGLQTAACLRVESIQGSRLISHIHHWRWKSERAYLLHGISTSKNCGFDQQNGGFKHHHLNHSKLEYESAIKHGREISGHLYEKFLELNAVIFQQARFDSIFNRRYLQFISVGKLGFRSLQTAAHTLHEPAQTTCTSTFRKSHSIRAFTRKMPHPTLCASLRSETRCIISQGPLSRKLTSKMPQHAAADFVRACGVERMAMERDRAFNPTQVRQGPIQVAKSTGTKTTSSLYSTHSSSYRAPPNWMQLSAAHLELPGSSWFGGHTFKKHQKNSSYLIKTFVAIQVVTGGSW